MLGSIFEDHTLWDVGYYPILLVTLTSVASFILYRAVYNRYLHPLRRFPGPFCASVSDLYNTYIFGTRKGHLKLLELHERYGANVASLFQT